MVMESILQAVLSKYLDKWFYGITRENIKASLLKGRFVISNIGLRDSIFINTNMPYDLRHSYVEKIQLNINWTSDERVVSISINKIYALLSIKDQYDPDAVLLQLKKSGIKDHINELLNKKEPNQQEEEKKDGGGISSFFKRLLDNVNITIKSIHLRFEDKDKKYSFGLRVYQIQLINVDARENPEFFNREKNKQNYINYRLTIDPLQIYLNPNQTQFLCTKDYAQITNEMILMDNYKQVDANTTTMFNGIGQWGQSKFVYILTISVKGILRRFIKRQSIETPQYQCKITFKSIESNISDLQFHALLSIIHNVSRYQEILQIYNSRVQIAPRKQRTSSQITSLIRMMKPNRKQKKVIKEMARKHLAWVFKENFISLLKPKFIKIICQKDITVENLFGNRQIEHIIRRIEIYRIKQWIEIAYELRKRFQKEKPIFFKNKKSLQNQKFQEYYGEQIQRLKIVREMQIQNRKKNQQLQFFIEEREQVQKQIILKLTVQINKLEIKISKDNLFGVRALMKNTGLQLQKRASNFKVNLAVEDLVADVFKLGYGQKYPTYVPILKKNVQFKNIKNKKNLLQIQIEKSPMGKPFVFSETNINFQSIQITIYAEVFSNLFQLFFNDTKNEPSPPPQHLKMKKTIKQQETNQRSFGVSFQQNIIEGFIQSPWIIIPLSHTNDTSKDCWVVRLGDLQIQTPLNQSSAKLDESIFYEKFFIGLKAFQLKYFTSIDYFYIWLQYENKLETLKKLPGFENSKHIDLISPISCSVDLLILKRHVSAAVRKSKEAFSARIKIEKVCIRLPKQLLDKLKNKVDVFAGQKRNQDFIQTNPKNVQQENTIEGEVIVSNQKFKDITLYAILKGYFIYFFFRDSREEILFTADVRDTMIRLTSDHHSYINEGKQKKLKLLLKQKEKHGLWKRYLNQLISKRDRINERTFSQIMSAKEPPKSRWRNNKNNNFIEQISQSQSHKQDRVEQDEEIMKLVQQEKTLFNMDFVMESLSIQLIDENQQEFLLCMFQKTKFSYSNINQKFITFSILEWEILEKQTLEDMRKEEADKKQEPRKKKNIPFLSCKRLFQSKKMKNGARRDINDDEEEEGNFLLVKAFYNQITGDLSQIEIKVDQLFISWNIPIFNKILKFFFYSAKMADAPTAPSTQKKSLSIRFNMQKFYLYCFHDEELIALLKLHYITINYSQSNQEQKYVVNCDKFEMDKYEDNDQNKQVPMIICPKKLQNLSKRMKRKRSFEFSEDGSVQIRDSLHGNGQYYNDNIKQEANPMYLQFVVKKESRDGKDQDETIKLKQLLGEGILISKLKCTWKNFVIYFDQEQTIRLINYFINQILGTVASKFKKKQYSLNYISQTLKLKKITIFDVSLADFIVMLTPHSRNDHYFEAKIGNVHFTKNIQMDQQQYKPRLIKVLTKRNQESLFYESMVFNIANVDIFYHFKQNPVQRLAKSPLNVNVIYSKLNFSREYEPILNSLDDIDRTVKVSVKILPGFTIQLRKIVFLTLLQIFYQNIKHRDGKADKFQTPHPQPAAKIYDIDLGSVGIQMTEYTKREDHEGLKQSKKHMDQMTSKQLSKKQFLNFEKEISVFESIKAKSIKLIYENQGPNSQIQMKFDQITAKGQLPIQKNNIYLNSSLLLKMDSVQNETFIKLLPYNLKIAINLDKLNQVIQFTNYDSDYVSNKIMPKKKKDSFMTVNVFPENCCAQVGELQLYGSFYITYTKDFKNNVNKETLKYLFEQLGDQKLKKLDQAFIKDEISDKEIKVNGQNISVFMNKKHIGVLNRLFYGRVEHSAKQTNRRYRKQSVFIDGLSAMVNLLELKQLYQTYQSHIKKAKDYEDKIFLLPFQLVPTKEKSIQKRVMEVQFEKSYVNIMRMLPQKDQKDIPPFMSYMTIEFMIPKISYSTYLKFQLISIRNLSLKILQYAGKSESNKIFQFVGLRLQYLENKEEHSKYIEIENAKNIIVNMQNMNEKLLALLAKQITNFSSLKAIEKSRNSQRKIYTQSLIQRTTSSKRIEQGLQNQNLIEEDQSLTTDQFYLIFTNETSKGITIIVSNFEFHSQQKSPKQISLNSRDTKVLRFSGIKMLQFLDQSAKQKNHMTQISVKQLGQGPIIKKAMKQILLEGQVQIFSWCNVKYSAIPNGIKLEVIEPYSVINMTQRPISIILLDKKKKKLNNSWTVAQPNAEVHFTGIQSTPYYFILAYSPGQQEIQADNYELIRIDELASNLAPKKIGPLRSYPSSLMQVIRWQSESKSNSNRLKLIIFNRFRVQNNLPVSVQTNFTTVPCFREDVIQCSTSNPKNRPSLKEMKIRIDFTHQIQCDLSEASAILVPHLNDLNSKPKKKETQLKEHRIPISLNEPGFYRIWSRCKVGYLSSQKYQHNFVAVGSSPESYKKISFMIENFVFLNQIVIALNCSRLVKNAISNQQQKLLIGWSPNSNAQKKGTECKMIPESSDQLTFQIDQGSEKLKPYQIPFSDISPKQSKVLWNRYILTSITKSLSSQTESLYMVEDLCTIQNKTDQIMEAIWRPGEVSNKKLKTIVIYPNSKVNIPIEESRDEQNLRKHIEIVAYCKNKKLISNYHLRCTTNIELESAKYLKQNESEDSKHSCQLEMFYWSLNPETSCMPKQHKKYQSALIKVTKKVISFCNAQKYEFLFESNKQKDKRQAGYGYKFINNLPKKYTVIIRQEKGIVPSVSGLTKEYERYYDTIEVEKDMVIIDDADDDLPSLQMSHKKFSNNMSQKVESIYQMDRKESRGNRLENSRQNNPDSIRSGEVIYTINAQNEIWIGQTNLKRIGKRDSLLVIQIYKTTNDVEFDQSFQIKLGQSEAESKQIVIREDQNKDKIVQFEGSQFPESQSANSGKQGKRALQVISKKRSNQLNFPKYKEYNVKLLIHKKAQQSYQFFIESQDLAAVNPSNDEPIDYKRSTQLKIFEISLAIQVTNNPKDILTLELQNLKMNQIQVPPSSHSQQIDLKIDNLLIKAGRNLSLLQMLHADKRFLSVQAFIEKTMAGNKIDNLSVKLQPIQLNIREQILFKILGRVVELRNRYFFYGKKLDEVLNIGNRETNALKNREIQSIMADKKPISGLGLKCKTKLEQKFLNQRQNFFKKELKKLNPKVLVVKNLNVMQTRVYFSFSKDDYAENKEHFIHDPIIKYFILIPTVSELKINIPSIDISDFKGTDKQLGKLVIKKIRSNIGGTILSSLSSLSVLDSPVAAIDGVFQYLEAILMINSS